MEACVGAHHLSRQLLALGHDARLLTAGQDGFRNEARNLLRAGLASARWITVYDTGARHKAKNGVTTQIGPDHFTWFATTRSNPKDSRKGTAKS
jgi:hypothetical protein